MLNEQEISVLLAFLDRVNLNGKEAETLVYIKNKLKTIVEAKAPKEEKPKKK